MFGICQNIANEYASSIYLPVSAVFHVYSSIFAIKMKLAARQIKVANQGGHCCDLYTQMHIGHVWVYFEGVGIWREIDERIPYCTIASVYIYYIICYGLVYFLLIIIVSYFKLYPVGINYVITRMQSLAGLYPRWQWSPHISWRSGLLGRNRGSH